MKRANDINRIISNTAWMLFDKVFILILNLFVTVRIANYYGTLGYGTYQYAVSIVAIFEIVITFVDARVVKKRYADVNPNQLVWDATIARMIFSCISLLLGVVYLLLCQEGLQYKQIFLLLLFNSIVLNMRFGMQNRFEYLLESKKTIIASNISLMFGSVLQLVAVSNKLPIVYIAIIAIVSSTISLFIIYIQYIREFGRLKQRTVNFDIVKAIVIESIPLAIAASCAIIYSRCDSIMIGGLLSKEDVGIYSIAIKLTTIIQIAISPVRESVYPKLIKLYNKDKKKYEERFIQITAIMTWIYIFGVLLSFIILPLAFRFLNKEYEEAYPVYQIYVIGSFFVYNAALRAGHLTLINRGKILMYSQIMSVIINIFLNIVLIQWVGITGAAIATCITQCISLLLSNLMFGKDGKELFKWQIMGLNPYYISKTN